MGWTVSPSSNSEIFSWNTRWFNGYVSSTNLGMHGDFHADHIPTLPEAKWASDNVGAAEECGSYYYLASVQGRPCGIWLGLGKRLSYIYIQREWLHSVPPQDNSTNQDAYAFIYSRQSSRRPSIESTSSRLGPTLSLSRLPAIESVERPFRLMSSTSLSKSKSPRRVRRKRMMLVIPLKL